MQIRPIETGDVAQVLRIYEPFIRETAVSFEVAVPTLEEYAQRVRHYTERFPWLVCEDENGICGYAYASPLRTREAYLWDAELSVYVHPDAHGKGIGRALYTALLTLIRAQGCCNAYAVITAPNEKSIAFHESMGFRNAGVWHNTGFKMGKWRDVMFLEKQLVETYPVPPAPFVPYPLLEQNFVQETVQNVCFSY